MPQYRSSPDSSSHQRVDPRRGLTPGLRVILSLVGSLVTVAWISVAALISSGPMFLLAVVGVASVWCAYVLAHQGHLRHAVGTLAVTLVLFVAWWGVTLSRAPFDLL